MRRCHLLIRYWCLRLDVRVLGGLSLVRLNLVLRDGGVDGLNVWRPERRDQSLDRLGLV